MEKSYLLEFQRLGQVVRVTALDPASRTEVTLQGPVSAGEAALGQAAVRKLDYVLRKKIKT